MTRWIRFLSALVTAPARPKLATLNDECLLSVHAWPTDADLSMVNHAAIMSLMEVGRIDLMARTGFLLLAIRSGWSVPVRAIDVRFDRPAKPLQRLTLSTRLIFVDQQWLYVRHKLSRAGKSIASAIVQATVRHGRTPVSHQQVLDAIGLPYSWEDNALGLPSLIQIDQHRPNQQPPGNR
jgi:acyl-CoA thioesterase FadM